MKDNIKFALGFLGIATIYVWLVSYGAIISYYGGYFEQFNINMNDVNFWPSLADFMTQSFRVVLMIGFAILGMAILLACINGISKLAARRAGKDRKSSLLRSWGAASRMSKSYIIGALVFSLVIFTVKLGLTDAYDRGVNAAQNGDTFTVLQGESTKLPVVLYQNDNVATVKYYNKQTHAFSSDYITTNLVDQAQHVEKIR